MPPSFEELLAFGQDGEQIVGRYLIERGAIVLPLYQFTNHGKTPVLLHMVNGQAASKIAPDFVAWKNGANHFVEVKRKNRWVDGDRFAGAGRGLETGFNANHFRQYREIAKATGIEIWVFFLHETAEPTGLFVAPLSSLTPLVRFWDGKMPNRGPSISKALVLFPLSALLKIDGFPMPVAA